MKTRDSIKVDDRRKVAIKPDGTCIPVIDSKLTTVIQPNEDDIKKGVPGDLTKCMYVMACKRMFGSDLVWITRSLAYVELRGKGGKPELHRFILAKPAKLKVKDFDAGEPVTPEAVIFEAPTGRKTLKAQVEAYRARKKTKHSKPKVKKSKDAARKKPEPIVNGLRSPAYGMFRFVEWV